jgi:hypothetical protein
MLCVLYVLVYTLVKDSSLLSLLLHHASLSLRYQSQLEPNEALPHILTLRLVIDLLHIGVEELSAQKATPQSLYLHHHGNQVSSLLLQKWLLVIVRMPADGTSFLDSTLIFLELLKVLQTSDMVDVTTTENGLVSELELLKTDRTCLAM